MSSAHYPLSELGRVYTLSAGPSGATPATLAALQKPVLYHYDPEFLDFYQMTIERLQAAFATSSVPVVLQGEAVLGLEAAAASLIAPTDVVLNLVSGVFGKGFGYWARRYAREVIDLEVPYNESVEASAVRRALEDRPDVTVVAVVHCETPSGTINDLFSIGPAVREHGALLLVDAVSSFGGERTDFDAWGADLVVVGPQKCLSGPPGLCMLHVSNRAWEHMEANPNAPRASILSILDWRDAHLADNRFPFTPSVSEMFALDAVLRQYLDEGAEAVQTRHRRVARATRAGVQALGLSLWAARPAICSDTVTAILPPAGVSEHEVRALARQQSGVMLSGGQGELEGKVLRIGHMGTSAVPLAPVMAVSALGRALRSMGVKVDIGSAVEAVLGALESDV
ncbi:MAG: alanine--glyoxylate aminotransferase family protein [Actinomycetota bacterium]|nr:alanine--glyoxylate aminotransferase family protein [Actinomycetota bacterium]